MIRELIKIYLFDDDDDLRYIRLTSSRTPGLPGAGECRAIKVYLNRLIQQTCLLRSSWGSRAHCVLRSLTDSMCCCCAQASCSGVRGLIAGDSSWRTKNASQARSMRRIWLGGRRVRCGKQFCERRRNFGRQPKCFYFVVWFNRGSDQMDGAKLIEVGK